MDKDDWTWPAAPSTDAEFEAMMRSLDGHLARLQKPCRNRSLMAWLYISRIPGVPKTAAFTSLGGTALGSHPLVERAQRWLDEAYRHRPNPFFGTLRVAVDFNATIWAMDVPIVFGSGVFYIDRNWDGNTGTRAAYQNALGCICGLTTFAAARLTDDDLGKLEEAVKVGFPAVLMLAQLDDSPLLSMAQLDYAHSVDALVSGMAWHKARWETAQAAEKLMKGLLEAQGKTFTKGKEGHHLKVIGDDFFNGLGVRIPEPLLAQLDCKSSIRYGDGVATREEAMGAHHAFHRLLNFLEARPNLVEVVQ